MYEDFVQLGNNQSRQSWNLIDHSSIHPINYSILANIICRSFSTLPPKTNHHPLEAYHPLLTTPPRIRRRLRRIVGNIAALPHLRNHSLAIDLLDAHKHRIGEIHLLLDRRQVTSFPAEQVRHAALVAIRVGHSELVRHAVAEGRELQANGSVEGRVQFENVVVVVVSVVERVSDVFGVMLCGALGPSGVSWVWEEAFGRG